MKYLPRYSSAEAGRHAVSPGLTGWAQINGRNDTTWEERFERDVWYVDHRSFGLDIRILLLTVPAVLMQRGVHNKEYVTMPEFIGHVDQGQ